MLLRILGELLLAFHVHFSGPLKLLCRIMSATVRDNILFCHQFEQEYYDFVLDGMCVFREPFNF